LGAEERLIVADGGFGGVMLLRSISVICKYITTDIPTAAR
tara:strand:+ start:790 stop:909 length:120 start_codon:yes stop_codon:yes gene_type:complete